MAETKQNGSGTLPKNIRQIGTSTGSTRVYLEDYVYTYLHTQEEQETWTRRGFMLVGRVERQKENTRYFISGLIRLEDEFFRDSILQFGDNTWAHIYKEMKKYYDNLEIVGWGQDVSHASASLTAEIERSHKQNFNIQKNVLFLLDKVEKEEAFYIFEKNMLQRREGYYVYYEKNPQMQEYMIESQKEQELTIPAEDIQEPLVHNYRKTLLEKKAQMSERKWNGVLYTTSMLLVLSVCVLGVSTMNNVEKMQNLESAVKQISGQAGGKTADVPVMSQDAKSKDAAVGESDGGNSLLKGADSSGKNTDDSESGQAVSSRDKAGTERNREETDNKEENKNDNKKENKKEQNEQIKTGEADISGEDKDASAKESAEQTDSGKGKHGSNEPDTKKETQETSSLSEAQTCLLQGYYIVKKGDSLVGISKKLYGTASKARKICDLNGIEDMDKIYAGQRLDLP